MIENKYNPQGKDIRFIDPNYKELFRIPDGGYITITLNDGEQLIRQCKSHGECHTDIGSNVYHICEFAEKMERNGNTYEPCPEPEVVNGYVITDRMTVADRVFVLANNPNANQRWMTMQGYKGCPGYDKERYWSDRSDAWTDYFRRHDGERTGVPYNPAPAEKKTKGRDDAR